MDEDEFKLSLKPAISIFIFLIAQTIGIAWWAATISADLKYLSQSVSQIKIDDQGKMALITSSLSKNRHDIDDIRVELGIHQALISQAAIERQRILNNGNKHEN